MVPFPENLPPEGLDLVYKYLIYFGVLYLITTAITAKLITKNRYNSLKSEDKQPTTDTDVMQTTSLVAQDDFIFDNELDRTASMKVKMSAAEAAIDELSKLKSADFLSDDAFLKMSSKYTEELKSLSELYEADSFEEELIDEKITDDLLLEKTDDTLLEKTDDIVVDEKDEENLDNLLGLDDEDDEFLKPRSKDEPEQYPSPSQFLSPEATTPKPATPKQFNTPKPVAPKPATPKQFTAPKPAAPKQFNTPKPVAPKPVAPRSMKASTPKPVTPQVVSPNSGSNDGDEKMFAKSTSIAAIRMDMLRELARLKKLINEDE